MSSAAQRRDRPRADEPGDRRRQSDRHHQSEEEQEDRADDLLKEPERDHRRRGGEHEAHPGAENARPSSALGGSIAMAPPSAKSDERLESGDGSDPSRPRQRAPGLARGGDARLRAQPAARPRSISSASPRPNSPRSARSPASPISPISSSITRPARRSSNRSRSSSSSPPSAIMRLPRGRDRRHRRAPRRRDEAALAQDRRLLVSARRHADRRFLAVGRAARRAVDSRPGRAALSRAGLSRASSSTAPARSAAMSAAPGSPPGLDVGFLGRERREGGDRRARPRAQRHRRLERPVRARPDRLRHPPGGAARAPTSSRSASRAPAPRRRPRRSAATSGRAAR